MELKHVRAMIEELQSLGWKEMYQLADRENRWLRVLLVDVANWAHHWKGQPANPYTQDVEALFTCELAAWLAEHDPLGNWQDEYNPEAD